MPTYIYRCNECGGRTNAEDRDGRDCPLGHGEMRRDYKAEGANVNLANCRAAR